MLLNPFVQSQKLWSVWMQLGKDGAGRLERLAEQQREVEAQATGRARDAIEESARLAKESLDYVTTLTAEWRKLSSDFVAQHTAEKTEI